MESEEYSSEYDSYFSDFEDHSEEAYEEGAVLPRLFGKLEESLTGGETMNFAEGQVFRYEAVGRFLARVEDSRKDLKGKVQWEYQ